MKHAIPHCTEIVGDLPMIFSVVSMCPVLHGDMYIFKILLFNNGPYMRAADCTV